MITKEYELKVIENAIKEKECCLQAYENALRQQLEEIEKTKRQLDSECEKFNSPLERMN